MMNSDNKSNNQEEKNIDGDKKMKKSNIVAVARVLLVIIFIYALSRNGVTFWQQEANNINKKINNENTKSNSDTETPKSESNFIKDTYLNKIDRAEDIKRKANLQDIKYALELYFAENGSYPVSFEALKLNDENSSVHKSLAKYVNSSNLKDPKDPDYFYLYKSDGKSFEITARLENTKDPECGESSSEEFCIYKISGTSVNR